MGAIASANRDAVNQEQSRKRYSLNRVLHRVGGLVAALLMLWIAGTGTLMQLIDLRAIFTHQPQTTATELSMQEGMYGPAGYAVIQLSDFNAPSFPKGFDINQAIRTVLQAAHTPQNQGGGAGPAASAGAPGGGQRGGGGQGGAQLNPMGWAELRMINGVPTGQVMLGTRLEAFNALTGQPVTPVPPEQIPQGRALPPSLRQKLKTLHRFWNRGDTPGVYFEFLSGLILMLLILTGLVMYFRLLGTRARQGRRSLFWLTGGGGWWRGLHRVISILAAAFILCIAFSGTWIGFESSVGPLRRTFLPPRPAAGQQRPGGGRGRRNPIDFIIPLRDAEVEDMTATTLAAMQELHPDQSIKAIRLRIYGQVKQGVVISSDSDVTNQFVFNADTGAPDSLSEQGYPESNFPFGVQVHENIKHFHSGAMFGVPARVMNLLSGFSLTFLSVSGLVVYFDMWRKRRKGGRNSPVWR